MLNQKHAGSLLTGLMIFVILIAIGNFLSPGSQAIDQETQHRFRQVAVAAVNAERKAQGIEEKVVNDSELQDWLDEYPESLISNAARTSPDIFLEKLPSEKLTLSHASLYCISAESPGSLAGQLDFWKEAFKTSTNVVAMRLYSNSNSNSKIGCILIAAKKVPKFDLALFNNGLSEFYVTCRHCNKPHIGTLTKCGLALAVKCSHCNHSYDLIAADMLGNYHRANDYLHGYRPPPETGSGAATRIEELSALWAAVIARCRYSKDLAGGNGKKDSWQTPSDTYSFRNGDCEDTSLLLADWLISRGFNTRVVIGHASGRGEHAWCVTKLEGRQYLLETTLGKIPETPPETQLETARYHPRFSFDRQNIYFINGPSENVSDYFSPELWQPFSYPSSAATRVPSVALNPLQPSQSQTNR
ncbi:MAG: transglutaminase domain-containing protein [Verrucomicrobiales bacterium]